MAIGFTFILAGLGKVLDIKTSSNFAANLGIFPKPFGRVMGFIMPFIELPIGIVLSLGYSSDLIKFSTLFLLLFFFSFKYKKSLIDRKDISCFCFGHIFKYSTWPRGSISLFIPYINAYTNLFFR
jgi:uncharacterized membrane protein YphA (DoxX/SURF4 family)